MTDQEETLAGGNTTPGVVKIGGTVRRPRGRRSVFAAHVLTELDTLGFRWAPGYLGVDQNGRDMLNFVEGTTTDHPSQRDERSYAAMGEILRELHDITRGTPLADGGECIVHGDPGPFNVITREGMPVALIDWDSAHAGDPLTDVGYAGWTWCIQAAGDVPIRDQARRLSEFAAGYGPDVAGETVLRAVERQQLQIVDLETRNAADPSLNVKRRAHARRAAAWAADSYRVLQKDRDLFLRLMLT